MQDSQAMPRVSVIIPNYNHARFLRQRIASILAQSFRDFEIIVLDDASNDESLQVIRAELGHLPYQLIVNEMNSGSPCSQWIKGIQHAKGELIWIAESDDSCMPSFLDAMVSRFDDDVTLAYCRTQGINEAGTLDESRYYWPETFFPSTFSSSFCCDSSSFYRTFMEKANCIPNASAVIFRRQSAISCQKMAPLLRQRKFTGDWLFWMALLSQAQGLVNYHCEPLSLFRYHALTTRAATSSKSAEQQRIKEYCQAVTWILQRQQNPFGFLGHILHRDWEWMLIEYSWRLRPSMLQVFAAKWLHGHLARSLLIRMLLSAELRRCFLPQSASPARLASTIGNRLSRALIERVMPPHR